VDRPTMTLSAAEVDQIKEKQRKDKAGKIRLREEFAPPIVRKLRLLVRRCKPSLKSYQVNLPPRPYLKMYLTCKPHEHVNCTYLLVLKRKPARQGAAKIYIFRRA